MPPSQGQSGHPAVGRRTSRDTDRRRPAAWVLDGVVFAAMAMVMVGLFQVVEGLSALFSERYLPRRPDVPRPVHLAVWGVVHLLIGVLLIATGFAVRAARPWARSVGIAFATISAVANFSFVPYSPAWSLTIIVLDTVVIWALCIYRWDVTRPWPNHSEHKSRDCRR